ncbi:hypothetical protein JCM6292_1096 [Bacteroides pyogenes JCM 6292]|uniref:Uncharacterized protein n=1 Tax=Bacteroides pyogenes JCM 6292 TaxID=1235809 RepID=W4P547_9BACE|nr:hypothetical protein JCM6292_1096 [Bacteroides pyogenes JCM 6292]
MKKVRRVCFQSPPPFFQSPCVFTFKARRLFWVFLQSYKFLLKESTDLSDEFCF